MLKNYLKDRTDVVDTGMVSRVKELINSGDLVPNSSRIADRLIDNEYTTRGKNKNENS